jgi:hypothetical protein
MIARYFPAILTSARYSNKRIFVLMSVLIASLIVDTSLSRISNLGINQMSNATTNLAAFVVIGVVYVIGQYVILGWISQKNTDDTISHGSSFDVITATVTIVQYILTAILILIIFQILTGSYYSTLLLIISTGISYTLGFAMMGLLAYRFFSWFRSNRNSVVLSYGLASAMFGVNLTVALIFVSSLLLNRPSEIREFLGASSPFFGSASVMNTLQSTYVTCSVVSFLLMWGSTVLLLRYYSQRLGKLKYWVIVTIPLVYFLSQFVTLYLNIFSTSLGSSPSFFVTLITLIFTVSKPVGGILFGLAFWTIARNIRSDNIARKYLIISAYGFILLFISEQAILLTYLAYPAFGFATVSFMGLASYLVFKGIYSAAISVSEDSNLRKSIRNFAIKESKLLDSIGTAQMEQELQKRVLKITESLEATMIQETGVQSSLSEDDVKEYLHEVLQEVKKGKVQNDDK